MRLPEPSSDTILRPARATSSKSKSRPKAKARSTQTLAEPRDFDDLTQEEINEIMESQAEYCNIDSDNPDGYPW
jgi:hypothetical protein